MSTEVRAYLKQKSEEKNIALSDAQQDALVSFYDFLVEKNKTMNLTALTSPAAYVEKHLMDAWQLRAFFPEGFDKTALDIGSGAGFPGIPLAVFYPDAEFTLLDATKKRCDFLEAAVSLLGLSNIRVVCARAEELGHDAMHREGYDLVTARAVARLATLSELCLPFVKVGGCFAAYKGEQADEELAEASGALQKLGCAYEARVTETIMDTQRNILLIRKMSPCLDQYPRRNGIPSKRPLS